MRGRAAQLFGCDNFVSDGFDNIRPRDEHIRTVFDHKDKVGDRGAIHRAARARAHDHGNLRHNARGHDIALKHIRITGKRVDPLLDTGTARVVQTNHRRAILDGHVLNFGDFLRMSFGERSAKHCEILTKDIDNAAVDRAPSCDDTVAGWFALLHAKFDAAVRFEHVEFFERVLVQQQIDPLARGQLAFGVLRINTALTATHAGVFAAVFEFLKNIFHDRILFEFRTP